MEVDIIERLRNEIMELKAENQHLIDANRTMAALLESKSTVDETDPIIIAKGVLDNVWNDSMEDEDIFKKRILSIIGHLMIELEVG